MAIDEEVLVLDGLRRGQEGEQVGVSRFDKIRLDPFAAAAAVLVERNAQAGGGDIEAFDLMI